MLSPLKPLLCRHDFYWSERHLSDRCRRCGKLQAAEALDLLGGEPLGAKIGGRSPAAPPVGRLGLDDLPDFAPVADVPDGERSRPSRLPGLMRPSARVLKAQAVERRDRLPEALERLIQGERPTREEAIDAVLAVIEDAHSADPLIFGPGAAAQFARLHEARSAPR